MNELIFTPDAFDEYLGGLKFMTAPSVIIAPPLDIPPICCDAKTGAGALKRLPCGMGKGNAPSRQLTSSLFLCPNIHIYGFYGV